MVEGNFGFNSHRTKRRRQVAFLRAKVRAKAAAHPRPVLSGKAFSWRRGRQLCDAYLGFFKRKQQELPGNAAFCEWICSAKAQPAAG